MTPAGRYPAVKTTVQHLYDFAASDHTPRGAEMRRLARLLDYCHQEMISLAAENDNLRMLLEEERKCR